MVHVEDPKPEKFVAVFVTRFCVDRRQDFVHKCQGRVQKNDLEFCKVYPLACSSDDEVLPILAYCQRYQVHFKRSCEQEPQKPKDRHLKNFCKAYDQFCYPKPDPVDLVQTSTPVYRLRRCSDVQEEARKLCNPLPPPENRLDSKKCSDFMQFCSKYVDWV